VKVISSQQAVRFTTGDALSPTDLNDVFLYAKDALADVSEKRFATAAILFSFVRELGAGINNTMAIGVRTQRFTCPVACTVVRAFLDGNVTAASDMTITLQRAVTAVVPTGATTPYLNVAAGATTAADVSDTNTQSVSLEAGVSYDLIIGGPSFTTERCNVVLHIQVDRWRAGGLLNVPDFAFADFTDGLADAALVGPATGGAQFNLAAAAAGLAAGRGMSPTMVTFTRFDNTAVPADLLCVLPVPAAARCASRIVRAYLTSSASSLAGLIVTAVLKNAAGTTIATLTNNHTTDLIMTSDSGALAVTLNGGVELVAEDFTVQFSASSATKADRASLLLWFEW
jgi:hypothetical protein